MIEPPTNPRAHVFMRILNADASEAGACGNATRCVAQLIALESGMRQVCIETLAGLLEADLLDDGRISVDMGPARLDWRDIPLAQEADTLSAPIEAGPLRHPVCTNMGNPHATFFVADADAVEDLARLGRRLEHDPIFPERANIGVASMRGPAQIRLRVWERGVGETLACGSGACAALVAASRRGLAGRRAAVVLNGGELDIAWRDDGHVLMTGPATLAYEGRFDAALLAG